MTDRESLSGMLASQTAEQFRPRRNRERLGSVSSDWIHVFTVRDGKVTTFREFTDTAQFAAAYQT